MLEDQLRQHHHNTIIMKDINMKVFLFKYAQEAEVIWVKKKLLRASYIFYVPGIFYSCPNFKN